MINKRKNLMVYAFLLTLIMNISLCGYAVGAENNHVLLRYKGAGSCTSLCGDVLLTVVFVDVGDAQWNEQDTLAMKEKIASATEAFVREANGYRVSLSFDTVFYNAYSDEKPLSSKVDEWAETVFSGVSGLPSYSDAAYWLGKPILFCLKADGRSFARQHKQTSEPEFAVVYPDDEASTIRHELLHLYGARDYYLLDEIKNESGKYFPDSIMLDDNDNGRTIDSLTAFVVGWTDELDETAKQFLLSTEYITDEDVNNSLKDTWRTGLYVETFGSSVYSGMLKDGLPHGLGMIEWENGNTYRGDWEYGKPSGKGTYVWVNGDTYTGDFVDGMRTGKGKYIWASGSTYTGDFVDGTRTGKGTLVWASGNTSYTGNFVDGTRTGKGTLVWASGDTYTGDFVADKLTGKGTFVWSNGDTYTGDFVDGTRTGKGTLVWASGDTYTGDFVADKLTGKGTFVWSNGATYTGDFMDGARTGNGTYFSSDGEVYMGDFLDGKYHGYGICVSADVSTQIGEFSNGEYIGPEQ